jgi:transposase
MPSGGVHPITGKRRPSSERNPIENAFSKLKALLRKAAERTRDGLWSTIGLAIDLFNPDECRNYFAAAGYDAT